MYCFVTQIDAGTEAGALCLDFANTAEWHAAEQPEEFLLKYADLLDWAREQQILSDQSKNALAAAAARRSQEAEQALAQAIALRECVYRLFVAYVSQATPSAQDLAQLNLHLNDALHYVQLAPDEPGYVWQWATLEDSFTALLRPVILSAASLLTSANLKLVKQCEDDRGCGYLFLDTSKNRSRRWCSMKSCGNRAKVRRHRAREHEKDPA